MNMIFEKKNYSAPKMSVVEMRGQLNLLQGSTYDAPNVEEYDDELGFTNPADINRKA